MDYIYKDAEGKKHVGSIEVLEITPQFQFLMEIGGKNVWSIMEHLTSEWCIHFVDINKCVELAYPTDVLWNTEALYEEFKDENLSRKIAYAIKRVFEEELNKWDGFYF